MFDKNWLTIALKSYTALAFYLLAAITVAPDLIYWGWGVDTDPAVWSALQIWVIVLGIVGRLIMQPSEGALRRRLVVGLVLLGSLIAAVQANAQTTERATLRILLPLVIQWEGEHRCKGNPSFHCAYLDKIANPPIWTACFGETLGIREGDRFTDRQCRTMLKARLVNDFRAELHKYFTDETKALRLTPERDAAYVDLAYNVGRRGAGRSTAVRRLNAGDIRGGCKALTWWNKAGGRVVRGLVRRRSAEYGLCMRGVT